MGRLFDAVETGIMPLDSLLQDRINQLRTARDALLLEEARIKESPVLPMDRILASDVDMFAKLMRKKLRDREFSKRYLSALVDRIEVTPNQATLKGNYRKLTSAIIAAKKMGTSDEVPIFMCDWRARRDSNS